MKATRIIFCLFAVLTTQIYTQCPSNCVCAGTNTNVCTGCSSTSGYYWNSSASTCNSCISNCSSCNSGSDCTQCNSINGVSALFDGVSGTCKTCAQIWTTCQSCTSTSCTQRCGTDFTWKDGSCQDDKFWTWANFWKLFTAFLIPCLLLCCLLGLLSYLFTRRQKASYVNQPVVQVAQEPVQIQRTQASAYNY